MKLCRRCGELKPIVDFHSNKSRPDGYSSWCKTCNNVSCRLYRETEAGKLAGRRAGAMKRSRDREKIKARSAVSNALRDGRLNKPKLCSQCRTTGPLEAHHRDYCKPLEIVWVCPVCHRAIHMEAYEAGLDQQ